MGLNCDSPRCWHVSTVTKVSRYRGEYLRSGCVTFLADAGRKLDLNSYGWSADSVSKDKRMFSLKHLIQLLAVSLIALSVSLLAVAPSQASAKPLKASVTQVVVTEKSAAKYVTALSVRFTVPKKGKTLKVSTSFNPVGSVKKTGKTQKKTVKAKWSSKGYYAATVKFTAKAPGKFTASAKSMKKTIRISAKSKKVASRIAGWSTAGIKTGKNVTRTIGVAPAYGRTAILQKNTGGKWVKVKSVKLANKKSAKVKFTLTAPAAGQTVSYRVTVPATVTNAGKTTAAFKSMTPKPVPVAKPTPKPTPKPTSAPSKSPQPTPTSEPTPKPTPKPTAPQGTACNAIDIFNVSFSCAMPAYGLVLDRLIPGDTMGCGVDFGCKRLGTATENSYFGEIGPTWWDPVIASTDPTPITVAAPDWLKALNDFRSKLGVPSVQALNVSTQVMGYTAQGQGGYAQDTAARVLKTVEAEHRVIKNADHSKADDLKEAWQGLVPGENVYCAENLLQGVSEAHADELIAAWSTSTGHRGLMLNSNMTHAAFGVARTKSGNTIAVLQMCGDYSDILQ